MQQYKDVDLWAFLTLKFQNLVGEPDKSKIGCHKKFFAQRIKCHKWESHRSSRPPIGLAGQSICVVLVGSQCQKSIWCLPPVCTLPRGRSVAWHQKSIWCPLQYCGVYIVMVFLLDQTSVAVLHSTAPLSDSHLIHRERGGWGSWDTGSLSVIGASILYQTVSLQS